MADGPVYASPQAFTGATFKMELKDNRCHGDASMKLTDNVAYASDN